MRLMKKLFGYKVFFETPNGRLEKLNCRTVYFMKEHKVSSLK